MKYSTAHVSENRLSATGPGRRDKNTQWRAGAAAETDARRAGSTSMQVLPFGAVADRAQASSGNRSRAGSRKRILSVFPVTMLAGLGARCESSQTKVQLWRAQAYASVVFPLPEAPQSRMPVPFGETTQAACRPTK